MNTQTNPPEMEVGPHHLRVDGIDSLPGSFLGPVWYQYRVRAAMQSTTGDARDDFIVEARLGCRCLKVLAYYGSDGDR